MADGIENNYAKMLNPEQLSIIHKSASADISVPTFFTIGDLAALFKDSATSTQPATSQASDILDVPIDDELKKALAKKEGTTTIDKNALVTAFCLFGYASSLGRKIEMAAFQADEYGQFIEDGPMMDVQQINPELFSEFENAVQDGAKLLFGEISKTLQHPERMAVMGFISPNQNPI